MAWYHTNVRTMSNMFQMLYIWDILISPCIVASSATDPWEAALKCDSWWAATMQLTAGGNLAESNRHWWQDGCNILKTSKYPSTRSSSYILISLLVLVMRTGMATYFLQIFPVFRKLGESNKDDGYWAVIQAITMGMSWPRPVTAGRQLILFRRSMAVAAILTDPGGWCGRYKILRVLKNHSNHILR